MYQNAFLKYMRHDNEHINKKFFSQFFKTNIFWDLCETGYFQSLSLVHLSSRYFGTIASVIITGENKNHVIGN